MAGSDLEAVETFISITGASEEVAIRKLEDYHGDLNQAVNAYFSEGDRNIGRTAPTITPEDDAMDIDDPFHVETGRTPFPLLSSVTNTSPFSLLDPEFRRSLFNSDTAFRSHEPFVSHPREVREIPIEVKDGRANSSHSGHAPSIEDITGSSQEHGPEIHGPVIIDEDDDEDVQPVPLARTSRRGGRDVLSGSASQRSFPAPSAPGIGDFPNYTNDIEEEMIQAAIEASKKDAGEVHLGRNFDFGNDSESQNQPSTEDAQIAHAVSLSLKAVEQEKAVHDLGDDAIEAQNMDEKEDTPVLMTSNRRLAVGSSSFQDEAEDAEEPPLVRHRSTRNSSATSHSAKETGEAEVSASSSAEQHTGSDTAQNRNGFNFDEWGGISSEEHDEAVMLEAALFGGIPESNYNFPYARQQFVQNGLGTNQGLYPQRIPRSPSPGLTAQRMIREQQDDEYLASLQADREKELKAIEEAEVLRLEKQAVLEAAAEAERHKEEELRKRLEEEQEIERHLAAKEASLPGEPMADDENAVTLLVRMPDGSRRGRRFLKSDKLQSLFDFIDVGRVVKPGSYRLVRPYPRRAFSEGESASSMNELGLTSKQEALFLELI